MIRHLRAPPRAPGSPGIPPAPLSGNTGDAGIRNDQGNVPGEGEDGAGGSRFCSLALVKPTGSSVPLRAPQPGSGGGHFPRRTRERLAPAPRRFNADGGGRERSPPGSRAAPSTSTGGRMLRDPPGLASPRPPPLPRRRPHPPRRSRLCRPFCGHPPRRPRRRPRHLARGPALRPIRRRPDPPPRSGRGRCPAVPVGGCWQRCLPSPRRCPGKPQQCGTAGTSRTPSSAAPGVQKLREKNNMHRPPGVTVHSEG